MSVNKALAERFEQIANILALLGENTFRINAFARASRVVADLGIDVGSLAADKSKLTALEGIGERTADMIVEFVNTGKIAEHEELLAKVPPGVLDLLEIPNLGPKTVARLWKEAGVTSIAGLKEALDNGSLLNMPRMGQKSIDRIRASLAFAETSGQRLSLGLALPIAERIIERLREIEGVEMAAWCGSLRRGRDTIGDVDIVVACKDPEPVGRAFREMPEVREVLAAGDTKSSVRVGYRTDLGRWRSEGAEGPANVPTIQADLRVVPAAHWGATLLYFTGSKDHNIALRERALKIGLTLNEYGLFKLDPKTGEEAFGAEPVAAATEEDVYAKLKLPWFPPEIREDRGELALKETPRLVEVDDIKAELHAHTTASDGSMTIEELASRAKERGFHTIAVTDHSQSAVVAGGLTPDRLLAHIEAVRKANEKVKGITILAGSEVDIRADGSLDYDDELLAQLDVVVASPHASLSQDPATATERLLRAIRHPLVHILGHPTGRLINRREGLLPDIPALAAAAAEHHVALEINAHWMRLDLRDTHVRIAIDAGALIAIDCDVHAPDDFDNLRYGVLTARRGWTTPDRCINTWPAKKLHAWLTAKRKS